ncbi:unnamed protein product [Trichobilharzia szidati]|nr:unnamed protein product [Trichobilharzia szidati]
MFKSAANKFFKDLEKTCIYEGVNRLKHIRCFGLFCVTHSILLGYLTYDRNAFEPLEEKLRGSRNLKDNRNPSILSKYDWYQSWLTMVKDTGEKLHINEMYPVFTGLAGASCLVLGFLVPRRLIRQMSLIVTKNDATAKIEKCIEIQTYGAFGISGKGVTLRKPLSEVQFRHKLHEANLSRLTLQMKNVPIGFLLDLKMKQYINEEELHCLVYETNEE